MKLHDLRPAKGAHHPRKRVGRGIAAGGGKTAGRGTKGQKARAGAAIPAWFEGGQTPLQMRIPKLHGFKNRFRVEYEVVNLGRIAALVEAGIFEPGDAPGARKAGSGKAAPITINQEILRAAGLVSTLKKPLKILGNGDLSAALFVVADAFSRSAVTKIEAAGGSVQVLELPSEPLAALGLDLDLTSAPAVDHDQGEPHDHPEAEAAEPAGAPTGPAASPAKAPAAKAKPAAKSVKPAAKSAKPAAKPTKAAAKLATKPAAKLATKPAAKLATKPAAKLATKPAARPAKAVTAKPKPAAKAAKPAAKPAKDA
jgi:large subunit ribosomal protein L15